MEIEEINMKKVKQNLFKIPKARPSEIVSVHSLKFSDMFMRILQFGQESERF